MGFELCEVIGNQDKLKEQFAIIRKIGGGGESRAFEVEVYATNKKYALVVENALHSLMDPEHEKPVIEAMMRHQRYNCHQAKIHGYFWITSKNMGTCKQTGKPRTLVIPYQNVKDNDIFNREYDNDETATIYRHRAYLLELGICDLASTMYSKFLADKICDDNFDNLSANIAHSCLRLAGLSAMDFKGRNHILVPASQCEYDGKLMSDFDYWAYHICEGITIYIPCQKYVVKRIDFLDWGYNPEQEEPMGNIKNSLMDSVKLDYETLCQKPTHTNRILDIYPNPLYVNPYQKSGNNPQVMSSFSEGNYSPLLMSAASKNILEGNNAHMTTQVILSKFYCRQ